MPKKMGRPTEDPRLHKVGLRLNDRSMQILEQYCSEKSVSRTEAIQRGIEKLQEDLEKQ